MSNKYYQKEYKGNNTDSGKYSKLRRQSALIIGVLMLVASIKFSYDGFIYNTTQSGFWGNAIGWGIPVAVTVAQFMFNTELKKLNLTIFAIGLAAYIYSIWTNIIGLYEFRGIEMVAGKYDVINYALGFFMDIYPEAAISWALGESRFGDLLGNIMSAASDPKKLYPTQQNNQSNNNNNQQKRNNIPYNQGKHSVKQNRPKFENLPKKQAVKEDEGWTPINYPDFEIPYRKMEE